MPPVGNSNGAGSTIAAYAFHPHAYAKALMHSSKHSSEAVIGIFVGRVSGSTMKVVDAIPLFHTHALGPMLKVACLLIEQYCRSVGDLEIVGLYHASASGLLDVAPVKAIADKIASNFAMATVWAVDAAKMSNRNCALSGSCLKDSEWKPVGADSVKLTEEAMKHTVRIIEEMKYLTIADFDDHLADASQNWLNTDLFKGDPLAAMTLPDE
mmetsp:Transcript_26503/g.69129  ORF Transcript_26503/g.69129 Transcript_26503/m.69129 type:complete len:211 (+) Transcript_26503:45-677(+)